MVSRRFLEQITSIQEALGVSLAISPTERHDDVPVVFQRGVLLLDPRDTDLIINERSDLLEGVPWVGYDDEVRGGMRRLRVGHREAPPLGDPREPDHAVDTVLERLARAGGFRPRGRNHLIAITNAN